MVMRIALVCGVAMQLAASTPPQPLIDYVSYLGGSYADGVVGIAVDAAGSAYVGGTTWSPDFPVTSTKLETPSTNGCAFVTKFNPSGTAIDFSICVVHFGAIGFARDPTGNLYLVSTGQVMKLDPTGQSILYTATIGALVEAIAVDSSGAVYVTGQAAPGLRTTPGAYQSQSAAGQCSGGVGESGPCSNAFVMKLSPSGSVAWATYLGGVGNDDAHTIAVDGAGNVWVAGETVSPNFPTTANAISRMFHGEIDLGPIRYGDGFVAKLDTTGSHLLYSTYLGGNQPDAAYGITVDSSGAAYITGGTSSGNFPTTPGAFKTTYTGPSPGPAVMPSPGGNGFVTKIDGSGQLVYSTFTGVIGAAGTVAVDASGQAYVSLAGYAMGSSIQPTCAAPPNQDVMVFNASGSALVGSSPIPGVYLALDGKGGLYSAGTAFALVFFSTPRAFQTQYGGGDSDGFVAKVDFSQPAGASIASVLNAGSLFPGYASPFPEGAVAPGEIVTIFGNDFGSLKPTVTFGTSQAPVLYSSNCQINAVVPFQVNPGIDTLVTVQAGDEMLGPIKLPVSLAAPGIFTVDGSGGGQGSILNQDSTLNSASNPAARGSVVSIYMTGTGALQPLINDGALGPLTAPFPEPIANITANIGGVTAPILFAGQAPGLIAGATQVNIQIPEEAPVGNAVGLAIYANDFATQAVTIALR